MIPEDRRAFANRRDAGAALADRLVAFSGKTDVVVLALPRGGVPVAHELARRLAVPLDVFLVRKLGLPGQPELAMGAIASGGVRVLNDDLVGLFGLPQSIIDDAAAREQIELDRRERAYRGGGAAIELGGRTVILVDDGLATGSSMKAAVQAVRAKLPSRVIVAVPVGAPEACQALEKIADEVVCVLMPKRFSAVGAWYRDFSQTSDEEVRNLLHERCPS